MGDLVVDLSQPWKMQGHGESDAAEYGHRNKQLSQISVVREYVFKMEWATLLLIHANHR